MVQQRSTKNWGALIGILAVSLILTVGVLEYVLPNFKILKLATEIGGLLAVIGFFAQLLGNALNKANQSQLALETRLREEIKAQGITHNEKLRDLQECLAKLEQRMEIHINTYGHKGITGDLHHLSQQVVAVRTELALSRDLTDAFDRLDKIERMLGKDSKS